AETGKKWVKLDGYRTDDLNRKSSNGLHSLTDEIEYAITGACFKHRDRKMIGFDFDCAVFGATPDLPEAAIAWIVERFPGAIATRGNPVRLGLQFKQSPELQKYLADTIGNTKVIWRLGSEAGAPTIEIGVNGSNQNFWGAHKSGSKYQVVFPETLIELTVADFEEFTETLEAAGWTRKREGNRSEGRLGIDEVLEYNQYKGLIQTIKTLAAQSERQIAVATLLSPESREIVLGNVRFTSSNDSEPTDPDNYTLPKGTRRHTEWKLFTDLAWAVALLEECNVNFDAEEVEGYIRFMDNATVPDRDWKRDQFYSGGVIAGTMRQCYGKRLDNADCREEFVYTSLKQLIDLLQVTIDTEESRQIAERAIQDYRKDFSSKKHLIEIGGDEWQAIIDKNTAENKFSECVIELNKNAATDYSNFEMLSVMRGLALSFSQIKILETDYTRELDNFYTAENRVSQSAIIRAGVCILTQETPEETKSADRLQFLITSYEAWSAACDDYWMWDHPPDKYRIA
ncbi:hypothetical protein IQ250_29635, partial [Pseudanabaenaceae cyanobacterium LEGE 13415]|nr:hypothetical protein [Pseudanabaenaceae cyanobacterium LEGE 13415]